MSLATRLQTIANTLVQKYGEEVTITRTDPETGEASSFTARCRPQPLTPAFVHRIREEGGENLDENDQRDFVFAGDVVIRDLDILTWNGYLWQVSTASEQRLAGTNVTMHALSVKIGVVSQDAME